MTGATRRTGTGGPPDATGGGGPAFRHEDLGTPERLWSGVPAFDGLARLDPRDRAGLDRVVVLAAHPDDETLGAGGLLHACGSAGLPVAVLVATSGEGSHPRSPTHGPERLARVRDTEVAQALDRLAPGSALVHLHLPDGALADHEDALTAEVAAALDGARAPLVVAPWRGDGHPDHEAAGAAAARAAARHGAGLLEYPVWLWHWGGEDDVPWDRAVRVDLDPDARRAKTAAIAAHRSQTEPLSDRPGDEPVLLPRTLEHFARAFEVFLADPATLGEARLEGVHRATADPWQVQERWYERRKRALTLASLPRDRFARALEVGCSVGALTDELAVRCDSVLAVDASRTAVEAARRRLARRDGVEVEHRSLPRDWPPGSFDLVVLSEVGYFCSPDQLDRLADAAVGSLTPDGVVLACHWRYDVAGWPLDGDAVHARLAAHPGLTVLAHHVEEDFVLDVLVPPPAVSVARRTGVLGG